MKDPLSTVIGADTFLPHGSCYLWEPGLLWLHALSDTLIAVSYFSLPAALIYFVAKRRDVAFRPLLVMFGVFILACGLTHVMGVWTIWVPAYWLDGGIKALTAVVSMATAVMIWPLIPKALALPSPAQLRDANTELELANQRLSEEVVERKQAERKFSRLVESAPDAIVIVDREGTIALANAQTEKWFGYARAELLGQSIEMLVPEHLREGHVGQRAGYFAAPRPRSMGTGLELHGRRKDDSEFPVEISLSPLETAEGPLVMAIIRDVSERRRAEQRFRAVAETANDAVVSADHRGHIVYFNPAAERIFGYATAEAIGQPLTLLMPERFRDSHREGLRRFLRDGEAQVVGKTVELAGLRKDGTEFPLELSLASWRVGAETYFTGIMRDVSERKAAEEAIRRLNKELEAKVQERTQQLLTAQDELLRREKLAVLGQVAGSVGHELRNPLGVMSNAVYFLKTVLSNADATTTEYLDIIRDEIAGAERIVSDLLDAVRTKAPQRQTVDVGQLIRQTLQRCPAPERVDVRCEIPGGLPPIEVDPHQIQQVLRNLITNAFDAMGGEGQLTIEAAESRRPGTVRVSVRDSGAGIAPEHRAKLFQALFTTKARGIGLGLVVVKNLTEANGGRVEVQSDPGTGTTFTVTLPIGAAITEAA